MTIKPLKTAAKIIFISRKNNLNIPNLKINPYNQKKKCKFNMVCYFCSPVYLWSTLSRAVHIYDELNARIANASVAFGRLRGSVWDRGGIRLNTKLTVYKAAILTTLLYARETWTVYQRHVKRLNHFHTNCLRKLLKLGGETRSQNRAVMQSIHTLLTLAQLRWTGHVTRMPEERNQRNFSMENFEVGKPSQGGKKKRYKDTLIVSLKDSNIPLESQDRAK